MPYPVKKYNYKIVIDKIARAGFSEVSAAEWSTEPIEYREGSDQIMTASKMPGLSKYGPITLKWGLSTDKDFTDWVKSISAGKVERKNISIQCMDEANLNVVAQWTVKNAFPSKYTAPDFKADENAVAFESIELAHEGFERTQ